MGSITKPRKKTKRMKAKVVQEPVLFSLAATMKQVPNSPGKELGVAALSV